jgi:hypothetical protein
VIGGMASCGQATVKRTGVSCFWDLGFSPSPVPATVRTSEGYKVATARRLGRLIESMNAVNSQSRQVEHNVSRSWVSRDRVWLGSAQVHRQYKAGFCAGRRMPVGGKGPCTAGALLLASIVCVGNGQGNAR